MRFYFTPRQRGHGFELEALYGLGNVTLLIPPDIFPGPRAASKHAPRRRIPT